MALPLPAIGEEIDAPGLPPVGAEVDGPALPAPDDDDRRVARLVQTSIRAVPDQRAQALLLQQETGLSLPIIEAQLPAIRERLEAAKFDPAKLRQESPGVYDLLSQRPELAPVVRDDIEQLGMLEKILKGTKREWERGKAIDELSQIGWGQIPFPSITGRAATPEQLVRASKLEKEMESVPEMKLGFLAGIPQAVAQSAPLMMRTMEEAGRSTSAGAMIGAGGGAAVGAIAGGVGAIPGAAAGFIAGSTIGFRVGTAEAAGRAEAGLAFREFIAIPGTSPEEAGVAALLVGTANGALEALALDKVFKFVPGLKALGGQGTRDLMRRALGDNTKRAAFSRLAGRIAQGGLIEGLTEGAQELNTILGGQALGADLSLSAAAHRIGESVYKGAQAGTGYTFAPSHVQLGADLAEARAAGERVKFFQDLGKAVAESKTKERLPGEFKEHLRRTAEKYGAIEEVKAPVEALQTLFQKEGISPEFVAKEMPGIARQIEGAGAGAEVTIPLADYAAHIAPLTGSSALEQDLRVGDGLTLREAKGVEKEAEKILAEIPKAKEEVTPGRLVFEDVAQKLTAAGVAPEVARTDAALWQAFVQSRAERLGKDPLSYYTGLGLEIRNQDLAQIPEQERAAAQTLAQAATPEQIAAQSEGRDFTVYRPEGGLQARVPGEGLPVMAEGGVGPLDKLAPPETAKPRKDVAPAGMAPAEAFATWRPGQGEPPIPVVERDEARPSPGEKPSAVGPSSPLGGVRDLYPMLWASQPEPIQLAQRVPQTETEAFKAWFGDSKVVDAEGKPLVVYHGAKRPDRIDKRFRKSRATSGPMAFFTDDSEIASKYATGKADTSLEPPADYAGWFKLKFGRSMVDIDRAWFWLPPEKRQELAEKLPHVVWDNEDGKDHIRLGGPDEYGLAGKDHWDFTIQREARGNVLRAAVEIWLNSAGLFDQEERFLEILRAAGLEDVVFDSPWTEYPSVFPVYLAIQNPLDTTAMGPEVIATLEKASRRQRAPKQGGMDQWDKRAQDPQVWIERLRDDQKEGTTHAWTSIPDWVTKALTGLGFDGIRDRGGKYHPDQHTVWIPFEETQVKSATGNRGTFDPNNPSILAQPVPARAATAKDAKSITSDLRAKHPDVSFDLMTGAGGVLVLSRIVAKERGKGIGSAFMADLVEHADRAGLTLAATPSADFGGTKSRIVEWNKRFGFVANKGRGRDFTISESMYRRPQGQTQRAIKEGEVRGYFQPFASGALRITLTGKANLSTFVHESGHAFLEILRRESAFDAKSAQDLATLSKWVGATGAWNEAQLEKFARGFEAYLWEGKSPSDSLAQVFESVKGWLRWIYATLRGLDVDLQDDVREVMDRLLATDQEIAKARSALHLVPPEAMKGLSPDETQQIRDLFEKGVQAARLDMETEAAKNAKRALGEEKEKIRAQVQADLRKPAGDDATLQAMNAAAFLREGKRLDGAEVAPEAGTKLSAEILSDDSIGPSGMPAQLRKAWRARKFKDLTAEGGVSADEMAPYLGYEDGEALVTAVLGAPNPAAWEKVETDRRFAEAYPDAKIAALADKAMRALHSNEVGNAIWAGMVAAGKQVGAAPERSMRDALRLAAQRRAAEMAEIEMQPGVAQRAEAQAVRDAGEAWKKGDAAAAYDAQRRQLWNHYLYRETVKAKDEVEGIRKHLAKYDELSTRQRIGKAGGNYLEAIDAILDGTEFRHASKRSLRRRASLATYLQEMRAQGQTVIVPPEIESEAGLKSYRQMTLGELRAVDASVRNLEHLAKTKNTLSDGRKARDFQATVQQIVNLAGVNLGRRPDSDNLTPTLIERSAERAREFDSHLKKIEFIVRMLDGGKTAGPIHELLFQPLADAEVREADLYRQVLADLKKEYTKMGLRERFAHDRRVSFLGKSIRRRDVLSIALQFRNDGNEARLLTSEKWDRAAALRRLDEILSDEDLAIVNKIGRLVESLWPHIAKIHKAATGLEPPKVKGDGVTLPSGRAIEGGYFPIVKHPKRSKRGAEAMERETGELWENGFMTPVLEHGFTEARGKDLESKLLLSLDVVPRHLSKVIHYVTHYEAIRAVDRLTQNAEVREAIERGLSIEAYQQIRPWLQSIAHQTDSGVEALSPFDRVLHRMRVGAGVVLLMGKVSTGSKQILGLAMTAKEIGRYTAVGTHKFLATLVSGTNPFADIAGQSGAFRGFVENFDRDFRDAYRSLASGMSVAGNAKHAVVRAAAVWFKLMQGSVNAITWYGAREKALREGHERPNEYADAIVRLTQSGGGIKDLAAVQRGSEFKKAWTVFYSWFSVLYNALTEKVPKDQSKVAAYAGRAAWMLVLPVLVEGFLEGDYGTDDDPEDLVKRVAMDSALFGLRSVPVAGDVTAAALEDKQPRHAPWIDTMYRAAKAAKHGIEGEDLSDSEIRALLDVGGMWLQFPVGGLWNGAEFLDAYLDGDLEEPVEDLLFRTKRQWQ